jgi:hypothetical protein
MIGGAIWVKNIILVSFDGVKTKIHATEAIQESYLIYHIIIYIKMMLRFYDNILKYTRRI